MLIAKGANVNELDHYQSAPIHCASLHGHKSIIDELVANGSNCSLIGKLSFNEYFKRKFIQNEHERQKISNNIFILSSSHQDYQGNTIFHLAARKGHLELIKHMVQSCDKLKKDINLCNNLGETPLHSATKEFILGK